MKLDLRDLLRNTSFVDQVLPDLGSSIIDTDLDQCSIKITGAGIQLYIGPIDPMAGGSAITISLDHHGDYVTHVLEELEADPEFDVDP